MWYLSTKLLMSLDEGLFWGTYALSLWFALNLDQCTSQPGGKKKKTPLEKDYRYFSIGCLPPVKHGPSTDSLYYYQRI